MHRFLIPNLDHNPIHTKQITIKKSIFIVSIGLAFNELEAKNFIQSINIKYRDASHNCYAYKANEPDLSIVVGYSDAGEPHGTAGKPMLNYLLHSELGYIVAVVSRYFGGIKLGTGGLQRAYVETLKAGIVSLPTREFVEYTELDLVLTYQQLNYLYKNLNKFEVKILSEEHIDKIKLKLLLPLDQIENLFNVIK